MWVSGQPPRISLGNGRGSEVFIIHRILTLTLIFSCEYGKGEKMSTHEHDGTFAVNSLSFQKLLRKFIIIDILVRI